MSAPAVFQATFSDFKNVKTRKTLQLIFEVPAEAADAAMAVLGGVPQADREIWVAVARIDPKKAATALPRPSDEPVKERRKFDTLPLPQQVAMRCGEGAFGEFIRQRAKRFDADPVEYVRRFCGVSSRSEIKPETEAATAWHRLDDFYQAWLRVDA